MKTLLVSIDLLMLLKSYKKNNLVRDVRTVRQEIMG